MKKSNSIILLCMFMLCSCAKQDFDNPQWSECGGSKQEVTIRTLYEWCERSTCYIDSDMSIKGCVVADDTYGNYFRTFVVSDNTGGIEIMAGFYALYTNYPVGRSMHINLQGMTAESRNGVIYLGLCAQYEPKLKPDYFYYPYLLKKHICKERTLTKPIAVKVAPAELNNNLCGQLVEVSRLRFSGRSGAWGESDSGVNIFQSTANERIKVGVRVSKYASFANDNIPLEEVSVTGILYKEAVDNNPIYVVKPRGADDVF